MIGKKIEAFLGVEDGKEIYITGTILDKLNIDNCDRYLLEKSNGSIMILSPLRVSRIIKEEEEEIKF